MSIPLYLAGSHGFPLRDVQMERRVATWGLDQYRRRALGQAMAIWLTVKDSVSWDRYALWSEGVEQAEEEYRKEQDRYCNAVMMRWLRNQ